MVRTLRALFLFCLLSPAMISGVKAQRILGGVSLGMNLTQVDGDEYYGFHKVGLNVGPMVSVPFGTKNQWSVTLELLYSQKGSYHGGKADSTTFRLNLDYAEIPLMVHYTDKKLISGGVGFAYGRLINYRETKNSFFDSIYLYQTGLSNNDLSLLADVKVRIWNKLWAGIRYQYTMKSFRTVLVNYQFPLVPETRRQYNNVISIRLTWVFNQPLPDRKPKEPSGY